MFLSKLNDIYPECINNNIINNSPKPYPSSTRIIKLNIQKYTLWRGRRRFKTSMLYYDTNNCDFCGKICMNHDDNFLEDLICLDIINNFIVLKNQLTSPIICYINVEIFMEMLKFNKKKADASICNSCYKD